MATISRLVFDILKDVLVASGGHTATMTGEFNSH